MKTPSYFPLDINNFGRLDNGYQFAVDGTLDRSMDLPSNAYGTGVAWESWQPFAFVSDVDYLSIPIRRYDSQKAASTDSY